jgi:hypothetical protein
MARSVGGYPLLVGRTVTIYRGEKVSSPRAGWLEIVTLMAGLLEYPDPESNLICGRRVSNIRIARRDATSLHVMNLGIGILRAPTGRTKCKGS